MFDAPSTTALANVSTVDWCMLAVLLASLLVGVWRGLVYEVLSLMGWVAAFFLAQWLAPTVAAWLPLASLTQSIRFAIAFVLTFIVAVFLASLLATLLKSLVAAAGLRPADRLLGALFGLVRGLVLLLAVTVAVAMTPLKVSAWWQESKGAPILSAVLQALKPALPATFARYLNL